MTRFSLRPQEAWEASCLKLALRAPERQASWASSWGKSLQIWAPLGWTNVFVFKKIWDPWRELIFQERRQLQVEAGHYKYWLFWCEKCRFLKKNIAILGDKYYFGKGDNSLQIWAPFCLDKILNPRICIDFDMFKKMFKSLQTFKKGLNRLVTLKRISNTVVNLKKNVWNFWQLLNMFLNISLNKCWNVYKLL